MDDSYSGGAFKVKTKYGARLCILRRMPEHEWGAFHSISKAETLEKKTTLYDEAKVHLHASCYESSKILNDTKYNYSLWIFLVGRVIS